MHPLPTLGADQWHKWTTHMDLGSRIDSIASREDLADFVQALRDDLLSDPKSWENATLERFLEALAAWVRDMDGFFQNQGVSMPMQPSWKLVGDMLLAAKLYE